jgi:hypothetical protein
MPVPVSTSDENDAPVRARADREPVEAAIAAVT